MTMKLLTPGFVRLNRTFEIGIGMGNFLRMYRPGRLAITRRPIGTGQARMRQPDERTEGNDTECEKDGNPGQSIDVQQRFDHFTKRPRSLRTPLGSKSSG